MPVVSMAGADDEVAALRAAAQKARDEAKRLAKELGKDIDVEEKVEKKTVLMSSDEVISLVSNVNFEAEASNQMEQMDSISDKLNMWGAAQNSAVNTNSPSPLRPFPVSLNFLETRTGGKITAKSLGVDGEDDVSLDDFKDATIAVVAVSSVVGVGSLVFLPENIGAGVCYFAALVPILWVGIGSSAPGILAGLIMTTKGTEDDKIERENRICKHEAGHFLCGYLCGLPIRSYQTNDLGFPCVEFHPSKEGEAKGREFTEEEISALSVVALSGSVAEVLEFGEAKGGDNDLIELNGLFRRSKEFIGAQKQQDLTRWGALAAYNIINANKEKYDRLVIAFREKRTVVECIAAIEGQ